MHISMPSLGGPFIFQVTLKIAPKFCLKHQSGLSECYQEVSGDFMCFPQKNQMWKSFGTEKPIRDIKCQQSKQSWNSPNFILTPCRSPATSYMNIFAAKCWAAVMICCFFVSFNLGLGKTYWQLLLLHIVDILK